MRGAEDFSTDWKYHGQSGSASVARADFRKEISIVTVVADLLFLFGVIFFGFQIFCWLRYGEWLGYPCTVLLNALPAFLQVQLENLPALREMIVWGLDRVDFSILLVLSGYFLGRRFGH